MIMERVATRGSPSLTIKKTRFGKIRRGLRLGAADCFDEEAYSRFFPLAQMDGLSLEPAGLLRSGPHGLHLFRVQWCATA